MALTLLNELQEIRLEERENQENSFLLVERVDKLLGHLHAMLGSAKEPLADVDSDELATQMAGLQLLGKKDNRESMDDFAKVDSAGVSKMFYNFLDQVDDPRQAKNFLKNRSADELLTYIATTHAPSVIEQWKKTIEQAQSGDSAALERIKTAVSKMFAFYQQQYNAMKSHLKVGGSFDPIVAPIEATTPPEV